MPDELVAPAQHLDHVIRRRRVVRHFSSEPVTREELQRLAQAAFWAPRGAGRRPVKVVAVHDRDQLRRVIAVSPGIVGNPAALIALCVDWSRAPHLAIAVHVDVGAAMMSILLTAEGMGLGACPVMSFHPPSVQVILRLPDSWTPLLFVVLGHPVRPRTPPATAPDPDLTAFLHWNRYDDDSGVSDDVAG